MGQQMLYGNQGNKRIRLDPFLRILGQALLAACVLVGTTWSQDGRSQEQTVAARVTHQDKTPQANKTPEDSSRCSREVSERSLLRNVLCDQKIIWSAPLRSRNHLPYVIPVAAATAGLIAADQSVGRKLTERPPGTAFDVSRKISLTGTVGSLVGFAGAYYGVARLTHNQRMREDALLSFETLADTGIVQGVLKVTTQRERPAQPDGLLRIDDARGKFWAGGASFPSGHATSAWALASLFASRYPDKPVVRYGAYGLAAAISASRLTGRQHFPSDVVVGSVFGYLIGRYVARIHHR